MERKRYAVAVDGPSGAGKSTLAKAVAKKLRITYVDTGAIYRVIGLAAFRGGVEPRDEAAVVALLPQLEIGLRHGADGEQRMYLNGEDVSEKIRLAEISMYASAVSALPPVRAFLLEMQRRFAREQSVIMDGRDIGTVVLPDAEVKIFLTADTEVRAALSWSGAARQGRLTKCLPSSKNAITTIPTAPSRRSRRQRTRCCSIRPLWILNKARRSS